MQPSFSNFCWLKKGSDFKYVFEGKTKFISDQFILFLRKSRDESSKYCSLGIIASKKVGNAVFRNRAKRRFRSLRFVFAEQAALGFDYVIVARKACVHAVFCEIEMSLRKILLNHGNSLKSE